MRGKVVDFLNRQKALLLNFKSGKTEIDEPVKIEYFDFFSDAEVKINPKLITDNNIVENKKFKYPVFIPKGFKKYDSCIILMHGLNERNWDKYLYWAEYLATNTSKPVILFPIAYHINRSPEDWSNPRIMKYVVEKRNSEEVNNRSVCFANAALSDRLSEDPSRFYNSGHQTVLDMTNLASQIKGGMHPLFNEGTSIDFFAYSIGAFVSEIILMANPEKLFTDSRLFIFCGGSIFKSMYGESRFIMDKQAYDKIFNFYCYDWLNQLNRFIYEGKLKPDVYLDAFNTMIRADKFRHERESFFENSKGRIAGVSLVKDTVMPYSGVEACMGNKIAHECFQLIDFPYEYSHESPFPTNGKVEDHVLSDSFASVFQKAASFLL
jgi:hypothetical protein